MPPDAKSDTVDVTPSLLARPEVGEPAGFQAAFTAALLDPTRATPETLSQSAGGPPQRRFGVYRNNVVVSLVRALGDAYPAVKTLVGERFFDAMAVEHVRAHPPRSPVMCLFGEAFPAWLEEFPPAARLPYLPGVARLERARLEAYHAEDALALEADVIKARFAAREAETVETLGVALHPSLRWTEEVHPVLSIWARALGHDGGDGPLPSRAETVLTVRPGLEVQSLLAPQGAAVFVAALAAGAALGPAAGEASVAEPEFDLAATLTALFESGGVTEIA